MKECLNPFVSVFDSNDIEFGGDDDMPHPSSGFALSDLYSEFKVEKDIGFGVLQSSQSNYAGKVTEETNDQQIENDKGNKITNEERLDENKIIEIKKMMGSETLESTTCHFCKSMPTNHYCRSIVRESKFVLSGIHICGAASCVECRSKWGEPEDFSDVGINHWERPIESDDNKQKKKRKDKPSTSTCVTSPNTRSKFKRTLRNCYSKK